MQKPFYSISRSASCLIGAALLAGVLANPAWAQSSGLDTVGFMPSAAQLGKGEFNHWYVSTASTRVWVGADGTEVAEDSDTPLFGLARTLALNASTLISTASAYSSVADSKLHVATQANSGTLNDVPTESFAEASVNYFMLLKNPGSVTLDLHLTGMLSQDGNEFFKTSAAGMLVIAMGSGSEVSQAPDFGAVGDAGELADSFRQLPNVMQPHMVVMSEALIAGDHTQGMQQRAIDRRFSVTTEGYEFGCSPTIAPALCGVYFYGFNLSLASASANGAIADFSHTLEIDAIHVAPGTTLTFDQGQSIPVISTAVPEPSATLMALLGLGLLGAVARATRHRRCV